MKIKAAEQLIKQGLDIFGGRKEMAKGIKEGLMKVKGKESGR